MILQRLRLLYSLKSASFNRELTAIYDEYRQPFIQHFTIQYPSLSHYDVEEIYNDSILAFYSNVKEGRLKTLTCSLLTYIKRIGENKAKELLRKYHPEMESLPNHETLNFHELAEEYWLAGGDNLEEERKATIYNLIERLVEPCKQILFSYYYDHFSMEMIAQAMGLASSDVAKTQKSRCMNKIKRTAEIEFINKGLI